MEINLTPGQFNNVFVFAARYAHNRQTGAAWSIVSSIICAWDTLDIDTKRQLAKEAKSEATCNHRDWAKLIELYENEHGVIEN